MTHSTRADGGGAGGRPERVRLRDLRGPLTLSAAVLTAMFVLSAWAWGRVSGDRIPVHWGVNGEPDGYGGKFEGLMLLPLISVAVIGVFAAIPLIEPRRANMARSLRPFRVVWVAMLAFVAALHVAMVTSAFGHRVDMSVVMGAGIGLVSIAIGAVLGRVESNFMFGVRTPWTLSSERSWRLTHRLAGRLFVGAGVATVASAGVALATGWSWLPFAALMIGDLGAALIAVVYSYVVWRRDTERLATGT